jgi:hypothetical protein
MTLIDFLEQAAPALLAFVLTAVPILAFELGTRRRP